MAISSVERGGCRNHQKKCDERQKREDTPERMDVPEHILPPLAEQEAKKSTGFHCTRKEYTPIIVEYTLKLWTIQGLRMPGRGPVAEHRPLPYTMHDTAS